jgi:transposase
VVDALSRRLVPDEVGSGRAVVARVQPEAAGWRGAAGGPAGGVHGGGVCADQRLCVADAAAVVWSERAYGASPVHRMDQSRGLAAAASGGAGRVGYCGADRLVQGGSRRGERSSEKGGDLTGPNPTDRGKPGSKMHVLSDRAGIPLSVAVSAANVHDSQALKALVKAIPAVRSRRGPRRRQPVKLHADKAYDQPELRLWIRRRGMAVRIARKGIESTERLGRHRWVIERTMSWLTGYHRLAIRYDRKGTHYLGFLTLAAALTCFKKRAKAKSSM